MTFQNGNPLRSLQGLIQKCIKIESALESHTAIILIAVHG